MNFGGDSKEYEKPETGSVAAVCYRVIDLGTQEIDWQGKKKQQHKVLISWELDQKMKDGRPFSIMKKYTKSLHKKAGLRADLESWRGRAFSDEETKVFTEKNIIGKACLLSLILSEDGQYVNIGGIGPLPKGMKAAPLVNSQQVFSLEPGEFDQAVFDSLSDKLKDQIKLSPEYLALKGQKPDASVSSEEAAPEEEPLPF